MAKRMTHALAALVAALLCTAQLMGTLAPTVALAAPQAGETGYFYNAKSPDSYLGDFTKAVSDIGAFDNRGQFTIDFGAYQHVGDTGLSGIAYCMDGAKDGPGYGKVLYRCEGEADAALSYLAAYGYPNATTICGTKLSAGDARAVTQIAIWYLRDYDISQHIAGGMTAAQQADYELAVRFAKEAKAYADAGGKPLGVGAVWYANGDRQRVLLTTEPKGGIEVEKVSANASITDGNSLYSLEGAVFTVYSDADCKTEVAKITTDRAGKGSVDGLFTGDYWVKETIPPAGYALDDTIYKVTVPAGSNVPLKATDEPQTNPIEISIAKRDKETGKAVAQGDGTLAGAEFTVNYYAGLYDVSNLPAKPTRTWTLKTDKDGKTGIGLAGKDASAYLVSGELYRTSDGTATVPLGTVAITETKAPTGYLISDATTTVQQVKAEGTSATLKQLQLRTVDEQVKRGGIQAQKYDLENHDNVALGAATLQGTVFEIVNRSAADVRVKGTDYKPGDVVATIISGADGVAKTGARDLPFGTYEVREKASPKGYLLGSPRFTETVEVREDGKIVKCGSAAENQVIRGDIHWSKVAESGMGRMGSVVFRVTSKTTGESHIVVTDENGMLDTSSSWNSHEARTNANDKAVSKDGTVDESKLDANAGVWFFGRSDLKGKADDGLGALPYDTYTVEELRCKANEGMKLVGFEVTVSRNKVNLDLGTVDNQDGPRIRTTLTGDEGQHLAKGSATMTLTDHVAYENLTPGKEYTVKGTLMDKKTSEPMLDAEGNPATAETTFKAKTSSGTVDVVFTFKVKDVISTTIVAFESLEEDGIEVAVHADIEDEDQTVWVPEIGTTAKDAETGTNVSCADAEVTIIDTVAYKNLIPGLTYNLTGTLMDKETEKPIDGVTSTVEFTPEKADGEVEVTFTFDGTKLACHETVVFESLTYKGVEYAAHADITDEGQTIRFPKIGTTATDKADGDHEVEAGKVEIVDTVAYEGLTPGVEYTLTGRLMDKGTGKEIEGATASTTITPDKESGQVDVSFSLDTSKLAGHDLVVFEVLTKGEVEIAKHEDLEDEGQTVHVKEPEKPTPSESPKITPGLPKTGDENTPVALLAGLGILACSAITIGWRMRAREDAVLTIQRGKVMPDLGSDEE